MKATKNSSEKLSVLQPFSIEMVNKIIASYFKYFNFDHTFFLFCKEANIDENEIQEEQLVECLQKSLLFMKNEKDIIVHKDVLDEFGNQLELLSKEDVIKLKALLEVGFISRKDICSRFNCSNSIIPKVFDKFVIKYPKLKKGRKPKYVDLKMVDEILDYTKKFRVGYQRMTDVLSRKGFAVTENQVKQIFETEGIYLFEKEINQIMFMIEDLLPHL